MFSRSTFTPIFSSGKLKKMFPLLQEINVKMDNHIKEKMNESIELTDLSGKFSMDALASCAFGVDSESFTNSSEDSEFVKQHKVLFKFGPKAIMNFILMIFAPTFVRKLLKPLGLGKLQHDANAFFQNVVESSIKQRKECKTRRNDLVDLMIDATEGKLDATDDNVNVDVEKPSITQDNKQTTPKDVEYDRIISTAFILLIAGYDTTATTMSYILYQLTMHQDIQEKLFEDIENAKENDGSLSYDTIQSLPFLDAVIHETLRMHPIAFVLERPCVKDYKLPNTDLVIKKGELVRLNAIGINYDPEIFPNPEEWNPDNFSKENRSKRNTYSFTSFSLGPRNCLAMRFALFEMKVAVSHIVSNYKLVATEKTVKNVQIDTKSIFGAAKGGLWVKFEER